ncbi:MAG: nuclear transport factor 2 family protein, partial [Pseudomonadota bacterium]
MRRFAIITLLLSAGCVACATTFLESPKLTSDAAARAEVRAFVDRVFEAIASNDPAQWRPLLSEQARTLSFRESADTEGELLMRERAYRDVLSAMTPSAARYFERWTGEPTVLVHGPLAVVWGEYDFWIDEAFSHCGIDTVNLARIGGEWKIAHFMWTVEREGCASAGDAYPGPTVSAARPDGQGISQESRGQALDDQHGQATEGARELAARSLGVTVEQVEVDSVRAVEWSDASLGCPQPGYAYPQVVTPGYQISLRVGGVRHVVHTNAKGSGVLCE